MEKGGCCNEVQQERRVGRQHIWHRPGLCYPPHHLSPHRAAECQPRSNRRPAPIEPEPSSRGAKRQLWPAVRDRPSDRKELSVVNASRRRQATCSRRAHSAASLPSLHSEGRWIHQFLLSTTALLVRQAAGVWCLKVLHGGSSVIFLTANFLQQGRRSEASAS